MAEETDVIKEQIEHTRGKLTGNLAELEGQIRGTMGRLRAGMVRLNPIEQTRHHPLVATAASIAAGVAVGRWVANRSEMERGPRLSLAPARARAVSGLRNLIDEFDEEISAVRGMVLGTMIRGVGDVAKEALPQYRDKIEETVQRAVDKAQKRRGHPEQEDKEILEEDPPSANLS